MKISDTFIDSAINGTAFAFGGMMGGIIIGFAGFHLEAWTLNEMIKGIIVGALSGGVCYGVGHYHGMKYEREINGGN